MEGQAASKCSDQACEGCKPEYSELVIPQAVLAELQRLPAARCFPPGFHKRARPSAAEEAADKDRAANAARLASSKLAAQAALDPTAYVLRQAADQLTNLVQLQLQRRAQRAARRKARRRAADAAAAAAAGRDAVTLGDASSESDGGGGSDADGHDSKEDDSLSPTAPSQLCSSTGPTESASLASASLPASLADSGHTSMNIKRARLQRQYAIDLSGICVLGGERLPLPAPADLAQ